MWGMPTRKEFMSDNVETKYRCIMDIARSLSMDEIQVLEKMLLDLWCDKLKELSEANDAAQ
tara:strand:+ start:1481 stop:1663 length:183 start_codon:yes stop_codon:yes gene_type:complete